MCSSATAASPLLTPAAVADDEALGRAYAAAVRRRYLWHACGDLHLVLPDRAGHDRRPGTGKAFAVIPAGCPAPECEGPDPIHLSLDRVVVEI
ncbi:hypothetical protein HOK021_22070 [Streptomyces hygroscopicus]|nr:hypothetical protein HOK021_22070 [Streptomyces hygroscopicus]